MGSGRGRIRRTQQHLATPVRLSTDVWDQGRWEQHLQEMEIENQSLGGYYGIKPQTGDKLSAAQIESLATELLGDLVASGALVLPAGASVSDFDFTLDDATAPAHLDDYDPRKLVIRHRGRYMSICDCPWYLFNPRRKLRTLTRDYTLLRNICGAATHLSAA